MHGINKPSLGLGLGFGPDGRLEMNDGIPADVAGIECIGDITTGDDLFGITDMTRRRRHRRR